MRTYHLVDSHRRLVAAVQNFDAMTAVARLMAGSGIVLQWLAVDVPPLASRSLPPPGEAE